MFCHKGDKGFWDRCFKMKRLFGDRVDKFQHACVQAEPVCFLLQQGFGKNRVITMPVLAVTYNGMSY